MSIALSFRSARRFTTGRSGALSKDALIVAAVLALSYGLSSLCVQFAYATGPAAGDLTNLETPWSTATEQGRREPAITGRLAPLRSEPAGGLSVVDTAP